MFSKMLKQNNRMVNIPYILKELSTSAYKSNTAKPFQEIPKVEGLPLLGTMLDYKNLEGGVLQLHKLFEKRHQQYGPIYREKIGFNKEAIYISDPADFEKVFNNENMGTLRDRSIKLWPFADVAKRNGYPVPLFNADFDEFVRYKQSVKKSILVPKQVQKLTTMYDFATKELIRYLERNKNPDTCAVDNLIDALTLWAFECGGITVFQKHFGVLCDEPILDDSIIKLLEGNQHILKDLYYLLLGSPVHKLKRSKLWKTFEKKNVLLHEGTKELFEKNQEFLFDKNSDLSDKEKVAMCVTVLNAAIATTAETALWSFAEIATHAHVQDKLCEEVNRVAGDESIIDSNMVQRMPYLRACLKEIFRVRPVILQHSRKTETPLILSGFEVPAHTDVFMNTGCIKHVFPVEDEHLFKPERWMKDSGCPMSQKPHPFTVLPFGHGSRACLGRRLAENELYVLYANFFRNYKVRLVDNHLESEYYFFHVLKNQISIKLEKRDSFI